MVKEAKVSNVQGTKGTINRGPGRPAGSGKIQTAEIRRQRIIDEGKRKIRANNKVIAQLKATLT